MPSAEPKVDTAPFDGTYVLGEDYLVFSGLTDPTFVLTTTPTTGVVPRAPLNGIEIVSLIPEPSSQLVLGAVGLVLICLRRR